MPRLKVYRSALSKRWYWKLFASNGRVVADGSEGYAKKGHALRAARRVRRIFAGLPVF